MTEINQVISIFIENWISVLHTILGKNAQLKLQTAEEKTPGDVKDIVDNFSSHVSVSIGLESRKVVLLIKDKMISIISNLMIGLDTYADEISNDDRDAFREALNQMFASLQAPLKQSTGRDFKFSSINFIKPDEALAAFGDEKILVWDISMVIPGIPAENFLVFLPTLFANLGSAGPRADSKVVEARAPASARSSQSSARLAATGTNIDLLLDIELPITVRIGSVEMKLADVLKMGLGSIIELSKNVDDPVDILVNDKLVAHGEVVVFDSNFGVRVTEIESRESRIRTLGNK